MVELVRSRGLPKYVTPAIRSELRLFGYTDEMFKTMTGRDAYKALDKHGAVRWVTPDDVRKPIAAGDGNVNKTKHPRARANIAEKNAKSPGFRGEAGKPDGELITDSDGKNKNKENRRKKKKPKKDVFNKKNNGQHTTVGKSTSKPKTGSSPRKWSPKAVMQKAKGSKWLSLAITTAAVVVASNFLNSFSDRTYGNIVAPAQRVGLWSREGAYIPEKYSRGYDTIKENMTDFGSRVNLAKTVQKVNVTPRNTTRNAMVTTTGSVTRSNTALLAHSNAINHTRY